MCWGDRGQKNRHISGTRNFRKCHMEFPPALVHDFVWLSPWPKHNGVHHKINRHPFGMCLLCVLFVMCVMYALYVYMCTVCTCTYCNCLSCVYCLCRLYCTYCNCCMFGVHCMYCVYCVRCVYYVSTFVGINHYIFD